MLLSILFQFIIFINMLSKSIKFALLLVYVDVRNYPFKGNSGHVRSDRFFHPFLKYFFRTSVKILKSSIEMHK